MFFQKVWLEVHVDVKNFKEVHPISVLLLFYFHVLFILQVFLNFSRLI